MSEKKMPKIALGAWSWGSRSFTAGKIAANFAEFAGK